MNSYFSLGTIINEKQSYIAKIIANAIKWIISQQNDDGTWGTTQGLDRFITTNHVVMTLLSVGVSSDSKILSRAFEYLEKLTDDEVLTFFWRSGAFLNIERYNEIVVSDMEYIWKNCRRGTGTHKDYPAPFFLLKLFKFLNKKSSFSFTQDDVISWILEDWNKYDCWYDRTSITSMALALIYDVEFENRDKIIETSKNYIKNKYTLKDGIASFSGQILDDSYLVFNLCESNFLLHNDNADLMELISNVMNSIVNQVVEDTYWVGKPPFGGTGQISEYIYPTAVIIRSIMSYQYLKNTNFLSEVASQMIELSLIDTSKNTVFISYCTKERDLADIVDEKLKFINNLKVTRFTRDVEYRQSFKEFMKRVKKHDFVVMLISDSFLKSQPCMFEVGELLKDDDFKSKLLFIVLNNEDKQYLLTEPEKPIGANIYSPEGKSEYFVYWEERYKKVKDTINIIESEVGKIELENDLRKIRQIIDHDLGPFLEYLSDYRGLSFDQMFKNDFSNIIDVINNSGKKH